MLVLSRKQDQTIVIGDGIRVTVLNIRKNAARLGIEAPKEVPILREELELHSNDMLHSFGNRADEGCKLDEIVESGALI